MAENYRPDAAPVGGSEGMEFWGLGWDADDRPKGDDPYAAAKIEGGVEAFTGVSEGSDPELPGQDWDALAGEESAPEHSQEDVLPPPSAFDETDEDLIA